MRRASPDPPAAARPRRASRTAAGLRRCDPSHVMDRVGSANTGQLITNPRPLECPGDSARRAAPRFVACRLEARPPRPCRSRRLGAVAEAVHHGHERARRDLLDQVQVPDCASPGRAARPRPTRSTRACPRTSQAFTRRHFSSSQWSLPDGRRDIESSIKRRAPGRPSPGRRSRVAVLERMRDVADARPWSRATTRTPWRSRWSRRSTPPPRVWRNSGCCGRFSEMAAAITVWSPLENPASGPDPARVAGR